MSSTYAYQLMDEEYYFGTGDEDLGEKIRKHITTLSNPATLTTEAAEKLTKQIDSLERLANNTYGQKYRRVFASTATGLTVQQCNQVLSSELMRYFKDNSK